MDKDDALHRLQRRLARERSAREQAESLLEKKSEELYLNNLKLTDELAERRRMQVELFHEKERAQVTLNAIGDAVVSADVQGRIIFLNPVAEQLCGAPIAAVRGLSFVDVFTLASVDESAPLDDFLRRAVVTGRMVQPEGDVRLLGPGGQRFCVAVSAAPLMDNDGHVLGAVVVIRDITENRNLLERMEYLARHDYITALPNRFYLNEQLERAIANATRHHQQLAVLFIDLDRFKMVNDSLGHSVGDLLLKEVAGRITGSIRRNDVLSRLGGDEFIVMLTDISANMDAVRVAAKLLARIGRPYDINGHILNVTPSIGISIFPDDGAQPETLIQHADIAMYHVKEKGRNGYQFFTPEMNLRAQERLLLEAELRNAMEREEFRLFYQPQLCVASGELVGAEALIRWNSPRLGPVSPIRFIPIAEETGLIVQLGEWVLREACRQNARWQQMGYSLVVAVNLSAIQFRQKNIVALTRSALSDAGLPPALLELELTESIVMESTEVVIDTMQQLRALGVQLAMDDFGTGYSSLSYLKRFPINKLKIDQSFVRQLTADSSDASIVKAIIGLGQSLDLEVIAEGVEYPEQLAFLQQQRCGFYQGYLFSKPVAADDFTELLQRYPNPATIKPGTNGQ